MRNLLELVKGLNSVDFKDKNLFSTDVDEKVKDFIKKGFKLLPVALRSTMLLKEVSTRLAQKNNLNVVDDADLLLEINENITEHGLIPKMVLTAYDEAYGEMCMQFGIISQSEHFTPFVQKIADIQEREGIHSMIKKIAIQFTKSEMSGELKEKFGDLEFDELVNKFMLTHIEIYAEIEFPDAIYDLIFPPEENPAESAQPDNNEAINMDSAFFLLDGSIAKNNTDKPVEKGEKKRVHALQMDGNTSKLVH